MVVFTTLLVIHLDFSALKLIKEHCNLLYCRNALCFSFYIFLFFFKICPCSIIWYFVCSSVCIKNLYTNNDDHFKKSFLVFCTYRLLICTICSCRLHRKVYTYLFVTLSHDESLQHNCYGTGKNPVLTIEERYLSYVPLLIFIPYSYNPGPSFSRSK